MPEDDNTFPVSDAHPTDPAEVFSTSDSFQSTPQFNDYQVISKLDEGGMGAVWRAKQLGTGRQVAIKICDDKTLASESGRERFKREVKLAASLKHPNIAAVYDSSLHQGKYCYVMQLIDGLHLNQHALELDLGYEQRMQLLIAICRAVHYAHTQGILHRDIKPSNILVTHEGHPYLLDFGLARLKDEQDTRLTHTGEQPGTPSYMAPEQITGPSNALDERTDTYALGVVMYQLLTGTTPYAGTRTWVQTQILQTPPPAPRALNASVPADLEKVCLKAIRKDPTDRYQSAEEFADDIERFCNHQPVHATRPSAFKLLKSWTCHPDRIKQMSTFLALIGGIVFINHLIAVVAIGLLFIKGEPTSNGMDAGPPLAWLSMWTCLFLFACLASLKARKNNKRAIWSTTLFTGFFLIFSVCTLFEFIPYTCGGIFKDTNTRIIAFLLFSIFAIIAFAISLIALISHYASNKQRPFTTYTQDAFDFPVSENTYPQSES